jgi:hypothetical protein
MAKINAELGLKVGNISGALNAMSAKIRDGLAPLARMQQAGARLQASFRPLAGMATVAAAGFAASAAAAAGIAVGVKRAMDAGGKLSDLSTQTGIAVDQLMVMRQAFENSGMSAEDAAPAVNRLQRAIDGIAGDTGRAALEKLGIGLDSLRAMDPDQQMKKVGDAIDALATPAERTAAAMDIFGRSGGKMLTLFADSGAMGDAARQLGSQASIMRDNAAMFDRISDGLNAAGLKIQGFFVGMASQIGPVIEPLIDLFHGADIAALGEQFGNVVAQFIQSLTDGSLWSIMGQSAMIQISNAVNFLWKGLQATFQSVGDMIQTAFSNGLLVFGLLSKGEFWKGVGGQLLSLASQFNAAILDAVTEMLARLRPILSKVGLGGAVDSAMSFTESQSALQGDQAERFAAAGSSIPEMLADLAAKAGDNYAELGLAMARRFTEASDAIDTAGMEAALDAQLGALAAAVDKLGVEARTRPERNRGAGEEAGGAEAARNGPRADRIAATSMGVFVKNILGRDPILDESRRQTGLLQKIDAGISKLQKAGGPGGQALTRFASA